MDTSRLSQGEKIAGLCSGLLVLFSFFPLWAKYEIDIGPESQTDRVNAWSGAFNFTSKLAILLAITLLLLIVLKAFGTEIDIPMNRGLVYVILAGLATVLLLFLIITGPKDIPGAAEAEELAEALGVDTGYEASRGFMMFIGLILAGGSLIGGYMHMQTEADAPVTPATPPPAS